MKTVQIRGLEIGTGLPKICASIINKSPDDIINSSGEIYKSEADIVEWRADWFDDIWDFDATLAILKGIADVLRGRPLLFTLRTANEGGEISFDPVRYAELNRAVIASGLTDLIDVELYAGDSIVKDIIRAAHQNGVKVIVSNHEFYRTPPKEELISRLLNMQEMGGDILKIAAMPVCKRDVLTLLDATLEAGERYIDRPLVTISMGSMGLISRLIGEVFGSAITFGAVGHASAPGQIEADKLRCVLDIIHTGYTPE